MFVVSLLQNYASQSFLRCHMSPLRFLTVSCAHLSSASLSFCYSAAFG
ncbi:unnamed protein product [Callosobruchus maculatus]|uniref:Uncharacterized protein n=1 Tax=Callosobruchus maculatus TaxID=64391 RepID=A0A653CM59_CALMS|nr:unnamed protein product [Callosobruchus maculatus]